MNTAAHSSASPLLAAIGRSWWVLLLYGLAGIAFGAIAIAQPVAAALALAWVAGVIAAVEGIVSVLALFSKDVPVSKGWLALYAIVSLAFAFVAITNPLATAGAMAVLIGIWMIVAGIFRIVFAIRVRKAIRGEWLLVLSGVLGIVLGVLFLMHPLGGVLVTTLWIGIGALVYGVLQVFAAFKLRKLANP